MMEQNKPPVEVVPLPAAPVSEAPDRFERWDDDMRLCARELWAGAGSRNAAVVERLMAEEAEGGPVPSASTIRRWAQAERWAAWADGELLRDRGQTLREIQAAWLGGLLLSQRTLAQAMVGAFDHLPHGGISRVRAAEATLRVITTSGLLALLPDPDLVSSGDDGFDKLSASEQSHVLREAFRQGKER